MVHSTRTLREFEPKKRFFVGLDSDGCVFDTMEIKHKECFCPAFIDYFEMQSISKYAREAWEFVNLYSRTRGVNRFIAVVNVLDLLLRRNEVTIKGVKVPSMKALRDWVNKETRLGNPTLKDEMEKSQDPDLLRTYEWCCEVNNLIKKVVRNVPPFRHAHRSLKKLTDRADIMVISQTPTDALEREWKEHNIDHFARIIVGQEMGEKSEHIAHAARGKYSDNNIIMIGDAPGDLKAAKANNALFYPIIPGNEDTSWQLFVDEALDRFFEGTYAGAYEAKLIRNFETSLPECPPW